MGPVAMTITPPLASLAGKERGESHVRSKSRKLISASINLHTDRATRDATSADDARISWHEETGCHRWRHSASSHINGVSSSLLLIPVQLPRALCMITRGALTQVLCTTVRCIVMAGNSYCDMYIIGQHCNTSRNTMLLLSRVLLCSSL